jgi:hypothetical protein
MERSSVNRPQGKKQLSSSLRFLFYVLFYIPLPRAGEGEVPLRFAQIREDGMPLPLFNIETRITGSRSGKGGSEGGHDVR